MSAKKAETKQASKKASTNVAAPAADLVATPEPTVDPADTTGAPAAEGVTDEAAVLDAPPIPPEEKEKPAKKSKFKDVEALVLATLGDHLPAATAAAMQGQVVDALSKGEVVTLSSIDDSPILIIHYGSRYQGGEDIRVLSERVGRTFDIVLNQRVADQFPQG